MGIERSKVTLCYGMPTWYKTKYKKPTDPNSGVVICAGGISESLTVAVSCDNGTEFVSTDRYDPHTDSWENHTPEKGQHVIAWTKMKVPW